jgi:adenylate kinase family enzyme
MTNIAPQTFIFIGRSGSGKGTQVDLLMEYLKKVNPQYSVFRAEMGTRFRDFVGRGNYTSKISAALYAKGELQPEFLAVAMWANAFIEELQEGQHIVLDGCPRKVHEAQVLHSAMLFYGRVGDGQAKVQAQAVQTQAQVAQVQAQTQNQIAPIAPIAAIGLKPHVVYVNVGDAWARERLIARKRVDDTEADITVRLGWYETQVKPTVEFYRAHPSYHLVEINGEQSIEKVHADIVRAIQL